jgi:ergothioneine biosynthesis protein EgtB
MPAAIKVDTYNTLLERLDCARAETDLLFRLVNRAHLYDRPIPERHRIIFYLGHLEAFDWNLLQPLIPGIKPFDASLDRLFAFGIDPVGDAMPSDQPGDWPSESNVSNYNRRVRSTLNQAFTQGEPREWGGGEGADVLLNVAIEHRLMHAETLAYMLHQLPLGAMSGVKQAPHPEPRPVEHDTLHIPGGEMTLGLARAKMSPFGWDNEFERHVVEVPEFAIDRCKVTNGQFLEFVRAGGYGNRGLWSESAWRWKTERGIEHPSFWSRDAGEWQYRAMFERILLPLDWPVYVSHAEASAYAAWCGKRLPTEAEWHRAAYGDWDGREHAYPWGEQAPAPKRGYMEMRRWDPVAVNACPEGRSSFGMDGMLCNGWEWTSSLFAPFSGFQAFECYPGYSANFFDGRHYVLKGGSPRTEQCMLRRSFRNWFQPHYQYVYAGFRCAGA